MHSNQVTQFLDWLESQVELIVSEPHPKQAFIQFTNSETFRNKAATADNFWMSPRYNTIVAKHATKLV